MTKKELQNGLNYWLKQKDYDIEEASKEKKYSLVALEYSNEAIGYVELAFYLHIIDFNEYKILRNKYCDYRTLYYDLTFSK